MKTLYGLNRNDLGVITINQEHAETVNLIYDLYLQGKSLGGISDELKEQGIPSPAGNPSWGRAVIDDMFSKGKYVPFIVSEEKFCAAQFKKDRRSNVNDNRTRKAARYNSQNVLSGLLICGDCGRNFRRITRLSGEVVWRCADKIGNGKLATCSNVVAVSDEEIKAIICEQLGLTAFDDEAVQDQIEAIEISSERITVLRRRSRECRRCGAPD